MINTHLRFKISGAIALLLTATAATSCVSTMENKFDTPTLTDFSLERIDTLMNEGDNLRALPLIVSRQREGAETSDRYRRAVDGLKAEWRAARDDGDWIRSLGYMRSFAVLGEGDVIEGLSETDLFLEGARAYIDEGLIGAAAALVQGNINPDELDDARRQELIEVFLESGHRSLAAVLAGGEPPESPGLGPLVDGTVTVWVNKGIRLVGTVGVPDRGIGSGFFIDSQGYLLTNYHVIESEVDPSYQGYSRLYIKVDDDTGDRIPARVVGWDKNFDLALLKTEMDVPYVFGFSDQDTPELGERIAAIGSPGGLTRTLSSGTVSAYARSIQPMAGSLQIDVPINPGNSGGPLLNEQGQVIGVVFAGIQDYDGVNFAIPGRYVLLLLPLLYQDGPVELPWFGVSGWDHSGRIEVTYVVPNSPAAAAGLRPGDIIRDIDGKPFRMIQSIQEYLITRTPGTLTSIRWERKGDQVRGIAALGVRPDVPLRAALSRDAREHLLAPLFGFTVERIGGIGLHQNYRVKSVLGGSIADEAGFTAGDTVSLRRWDYLEEFDAVAIHLFLKGRKAGFLESAIQIAAPLNVNTVF